jgi:hypothetical protein
MHNHLNRDALVIFLKGKEFLVAMPGLQSASTVPFAISRAAKSVVVPWRK